jgi:flagellar M-ring protein FliF
MMWLKQFLSRLLSRADGAGLRPADFLKTLFPLILLALGITALAMLVLWRDQSSYRPLFGAHEKVAAADVMTVLDSAGISYRVHPDTGQVLVPERELGRIRMLLASKGVVAKLPAGLELMDHNDPLGVSQFVQDVRFRRGLEGELAQSIMTLDAVESARVHLAIAHSSSFVVSDGDKSSASVVLTLKAGRELGHEQIAGILNMVAGSVAGLDAARVTLIDQAGNLLSARIDLSEGMESAQGNDAARAYQEETRKNVHDLLAPVIGDDNFKASITADIDNDRIKETHEQYGDAPRVTNEALRQEVSKDPLALGVPGSLSNRPIDVPESDPPATEASSAQRKETNRQYAYDRNITQIQRSRGRLRKLSVAVVLNNAVAPGGKGVWTPDQLANISGILRGGLGIDDARGDKLVVSSLTFPSRPIAPPWWRQPDNLIDYGKWVVYSILGLLGFFLIVRPLMAIARQRLALPAASVAAVSVSAPEALAAPAAPGAAAARVERRSGGTTPVGPLLDDYDLPPAGSPVDVMVDHLKVLAAKEPERVAEVVKQWVQNNVRSE